MSDLDYQSENEPIFWLGGYPIRGAALLVVIHTGCLFAYLLLDFLLPIGWSNYLIFSTSGFLHGLVYTPLTYGFVHDPRGALFFAIAMYMLWAFGSQVEQFLGRRAFFQLYALVWFITPLVLLPFAGLANLQAAGAQEANFSVFIAFAALYPSARMLLGITAWAAAVLLVAISAVVAVANRDLITLITLFATCGAAWAFVAWQKGQLQFQVPSFLRPKPKFRVLPKPQPPRRPPPAERRDASMDDVDALLDKIARTGLNSLTADERSRLERASADLKKDR